MKNTSDFMTKTQVRERRSGMLKETWVNAIDVGYSSVKVYSPNVILRFPSFVRRIDEHFSYIGKAPKDSIIYRDETGIWLVGSKAQETMSAKDTSFSEAALYGRDRYYADLYRICTNVGLVLGHRRNDFGDPAGKRMLVQTGLPDQYMDDEYDLRDAMAGERGFDLKIGDGDWEEHVLDIKDEDISVMSQPKGTLFSICIDQEGQFLPEAKRYLNSSGIVFDPGFGTLDLFQIEKSTVGHGETWSDLGMRRVFKETAEAIRKRYHVSISIPAMQQFLETGKIRDYDRKTRMIKEFRFDDILNESSIRVCDEAIDRMTQVLNLAQYEYMIVTGGTGAAWFKHISEFFENSSGKLEIIPGCRNDDLSFVYSNARGYYYYRFNKVKAQEQGRTAR